jgi:protein TonB
MALYAPGARAVRRNRHLRFLRSFFGVDRDGAGQTGYQRSVSFSLLSLAPRAVAIAASGVVHATVFASLVFTTQGHAAAPAAAPVIAIDIVEELQRPDLVPPPEPVTNHAAEPETHHHAYPVPPSHDAKPHDPSLVHAATPVTEPHEPTAPPEALTAAPEAPARFTIVVPPVGGSAAGAGAGGGPGVGSGGSGGNGAGPTAEATYGENAVSSRAKVVTSAAPTYPPKARSEEVESDVPLEIVVDTQGHVVEARVLNRAGFGFDEAALTAIRSYRFSPAQREGRAVRVRMRWSVQFRLR